MAEVLIIRHAEPELRGVFLGSLDPGLSETGRVMAAEIVVPDDLNLYVSPKRRARETADAIRSGFQIVEGLREIDYGPWEGLSWKQIESQYPKESELKMQDWLGYTVPGAEPWAHFRKRVEMALMECTAPYAIVAHLAVNSVIQEIITGKPAYEFRQAYCEIVRLTL